MKIYRIILYLMFVTTSFSALCQDRGMQPVQINIDGKPTALYSQSHALVIGISDYWKLSTLNGVMDDVFAVKAALENQGFDVTVKTNLTKSQLDEAFTDFISKYGQNRDARLLIYYAGHGHTVKTSYGENLGYLVPIDAPKPTANNTGAFQEKCMEISQIEIYAKRIQSKHALFIFDACFSGSIFENTRAVPEYISHNTMLDVREFIASGQANETVPDQSIFRRQFVVALNGEADNDKDGYITGSELGDFLYKTVSNYSQGYQHPQFGKMRNPLLDKGDFVFVVNKNQSINTQVTYEYPNYAPNVPLSLFVSPTKMNIFYIGIDNPVSISVPGIADENLIPSISVGTLARDSKGKDWIVRVPPGQSKAIISVSAFNQGESRQIGSAEFRIRRTPSPTAEIAGQVEGTIDKSTLLAAGAIIPAMRDFEFDIFNEVKSFRMITIIGGDGVSKRAESNRFTGEMVSIIQSARKGQKFFFENIQAEGPDKILRSLNPISLEIK
jgi:hypothetical protein